MAYVAPTIRSAGDAVTAADYNIMANNAIFLAKPPMARLRLTSNVGFSNATHGTLAFTSSIATEDYDTDTMISLSGSASAITIKTAGVYNCAASICYAVNVTGMRFLRIVRTRSGTKTAVAQLFVNAQTASEGHLSVSGMIECAVNDTIDMWGFQSSGSTINVIPADPSGIEYGGTWLSAAWLGFTS